MIEASDDDLQAMINDSDPVLDGYVDDPDWRVGYPHRINGSSVTVYLLESGWSWSHGHGGRIGLATERDAKISAAAWCLGR